MTNSARNTVLEHMHRILLVRDATGLTDGQLLERFAGQAVRFQFAVSCERREAETLETAGWALPRLVVPVPPPS